MATIIPIYKSLFGQDVLIGIEVLTSRRILCVNLPTKYIGDGNDITWAVLKILAVRQLKEVECFQEAMEVHFANCFPEREEEEDETNS